MRTYAGAGYAVGDIAVAGLNRQKATLLDPAHAANKKLLAPFSKNLIRLTPDAVNVAAGVEVELIDPGVTLNNLIKLLFVSATNK
jgi:hypothetical protein